MRAGKYVIVGLTASAAILIAVLAAIPSTDSFSPSNPLWNGLSIAAGELRLTPIGASGVKYLPPAPTAVLIIGPDKAFTRGEAGELLNYVGRGGELIIADDFGSGNQLLKEMGLGIRLSGYLLADPLFKYKSQYLPEVTVNLSGKEMDIYYNYGTTIVGAGFKCVGYSSMFSYLDKNLNGAHDPGEPKGPFCVIAIKHLGRGEVVVISDPSILINSMIGLGNNTAFIKELIKGRHAYLVTDKWVHSPYTVVRGAVVGALITAFTTSLKYPVTAALSITLFYAGLTAYSRIRVKGREEVLEEALLREILSKHPDWDEGVVRKLIKEVTGSGKRR